MLMSAFAAWGYNMFQGLGCLPIKTVKILINDRDFSCSKLLTMIKCMFFFKKKNK